MVGTGNVLTLVALLATFTVAKPIAGSNRSLNRRADNETTTGSETATATEITTATQTGTETGTDTATETASTTETTTANATATTSEAAAPTATSNETYARPWTNNWVLDGSWQGDQFLAGDWQFETFDDPTMGRVNYVNQSYAQDHGLAWNDGTKFGMAADHKNKVAAGARGRDSVRISTQKLWKDAVFIIDVAHMPTGCGTWPAFWTVGDGDNWPADGEIDIIEGTHEETRNYMSIHTGNGDKCQVPAHRNNQPGWEFDGEEKQNLCDGGGGCNVGVKTEDSFGAGLNKAGGGWYVTRRDVRGVSMWFYPRTAGDKIPDALLNPTDNLDETLLGKKIADFPATEKLCHNMDDILKGQRLILNLTFCGGWGNSLWDGGDCKKKHEMTCNAFVDEHPEAFEEAFWLVNGVWVYTPGGQ